jgi:hypothetical protein
LTSHTWKKEKWCKYKAEDFSPQETNRNKNNENRTRDPCKSHYTIIQDYREGESVTLDELVESKEKARGTEYDSCSGPIP